MKKILLLCSVGAILASFPVLAMTPEFAKMLGVLEESGGGGKTPLKRSNSVEFCEGMPPEDLLQESSSEDAEGDQDVLRTERSIKTLGGVWSGFHLEIFKEFVREKKDQFTKLPSYNDVLERARGEKGPEGKDKIMEAYATLFFTEYKDPPTEKELVQKNEVVWGGILSGQDMDGRLKEIEDLDFKRDMRSIKRLAEEFFSDRSQEKEFEELVQGWGELFPDVQRGSGSQEEKEDFLFEMLGLVGCSKTAEDMGRGKLEDDYLAFKFVSEVFTCCALERATGKKLSPFEPFLLLGKILLGKKLSAL